MTIAERVRAHEAQMIADRRWLHEHPELSGQEEKTAAYVAAALEAMGLRVDIVPEGGVIGVLNEEAQGPCVLLRADMDALPIQESGENLAGKKCCVSQTPGVSHACGHDAHTAMLLCAARVLSQMKEEIPGSVLFVFEQCEEQGGRLHNLLPYIETHFAVDACYATHVRWDIPTGKIAVLDGAVMAGAFGFDVTIHGRGGHGSRPDLACSPVDCFCAIHQQLSALRLRAVDPTQVLTYSLGIVQAGEQGNVIPDDLRFAGTVRTYDAGGSGERFAREMKTIIEHTCAAYGCTYTLTRFTKPLYEAANFPPAAALARQAIAGALGEDALVSCAPWMASESMSAYLQLWPGVLSFTGIRNEALGSGANHHTPQFDVDETALASGAAAACAYALGVMEHGAPSGFARRIVSLEDLVSRSI